MKELRSRELPLAGAAPAGLVAATLFLAACSPPPAEEAVRLAGYRAATEEILQAAGWRTDLGRREIPLGAIRTANLSPAAFVPIRAPRHAAAAALELDPAEPVLVVRGENEVLAWPLRWLLERELALDEVAGAPVAVTFCSLCSTSRVLDRRLDGEVLDLAVSGLLLEGNSLLYDRRTESLWRQIDGTAIAGTHTGRRLAEIPSFVVSFGELRRARPDALVMVEPDPAPVPPFSRIAAEDIAGGEPPAWMSLTCPRPFEATLAFGGGAGGGRSGPAGTRPSRVVAVDGPPVENLGELVVFRDATCAAPYRADDGTAGPVTGSAAAFRRDLDGQRLTFEPDDAGIVDVETGSHWSRLGEAVEGPLAGRRLEVAPQVQGFRYALEEAETL